jgi:nitrogen-specific signal transduction histidine kinase
MTFEQKWLEYDYNPFILFSNDGRVISLNSEAQFLLNNDIAHDIFQLALSYANVTFGFKTTFLDLEFGNYKFFAFTVGYEDEETIGIKLYRTPIINIAKIKPNDGQLVNIYTLIDLCIATNSINSNIEFKKEFDPAIPEFIINSDSLTLSISA